MPAVLFLDVVARAEDHPNKRKVGACRGPRPPTRGRVPSLPGLPIYETAYPALKRWAKLFRPARRDWIVVGSGSIDVPGLHSPPCRLRSEQALSLRDKGGCPDILFGDLMNAS
jgi:hypothetical protein